MAKRKPKDTGKNPDFGVMMYLMTLVQHAQHNGTEIDLVFVEACLVDLGYNPEKIIEGWDEFCALVKNAFCREAEDIESNAKIISQMTDRVRGEG